MSESLTSLTKNEPMSELLIFLERIAHFWAKNERFVKKTDERIPSLSKMAKTNYFSHFERLRLKQNLFLSFFKS